MSGRREMHKWNMQRRMNAQISIEFLLLFSVAVLALAITFHSFDMLSKASSSSTSRAFFVRESSFFYELTKDLCASGDGNIRKVNFPYVFEVSYRDGEVFLNSTSGNMTYPLPCPVEPSIIKGEILLINENGKIIIKDSS